MVAGGGLFVVALVAVPLAAGFEEGKTLSDIFLFLFWPSKSCVRTVKGENEERGCKGKRR